MAKNNENKQRLAQNISSNSSPNQKENRPRKALKKPKPNPDNTIAMSKQLQMKKKTAQNKSRAKSQSKNIRLCGNGKIMPSLTDLEVLFEDSDDDSDNNPSKVHKHIESPASPQQEMPIVIDTGTLISPTTRHKISEQAKEILLKIDDSNSQIPNETDEPPKKRLKFEEQDCNLVISPAHTTTVNTDTMAINDSNVNCESIPNLLIEDKNTSNSSSDTIEYKLNPSMFCPLPSTSKNSEIFIKNDELFNISLRESSSARQLSKEINIDVSNNTTDTTPINSDMNNEQLENNINSEVCIKSDEISNENNITSDKPFENDDTDLQIIETPIEIIVVDDEIKGDQSENNSHVMTPMNNNLIKVDLCDDDDDDDDCIFVEPEINNRNQQSISTDDNIHEYGFTEPLMNFVKAEHMKDEIIDVDAVIAQNQTILNQYVPNTKQLDTTNLVVDVDVSKITASTSEMSPNNQIRGVFLPENSINAINTQRRDDTLISSLSGLQHDINNMIDLNTNVPCVAANTPVSFGQNPSCKDMITSQVKKFFNNYRPSKAWCWNTTTSNLELPNFSLHNATVPNQISMANDNNSFPSINENVTTSSFSPPQSNMPSSSLSQSNIPSSSLPQSNMLSSTFPQINMLSSTFPQSNMGSLSPQRNITSSLLMPEINITPSLILPDIDMTLLSPQRNLTTLSPPRNMTLIERLRCIPTMQRKRGSRKRKSTSINNITQSLVSTSEQERPSGSLGDCPICMDSLTGKVIASTICGHVFCMRCLQQAITTNKRCPSCRKILNKKNGYHQIFL